MKIPPILLGKKNEKEESPFLSGRQYSSGRTALYAILKAIKKQNTGGVLLPDYICSTVTQAVIDAEVVYGFYHIDRSMEVDWDSLSRLIDESYYSSVLLTNYFGMINLSEVIKVIRKTHPEIEIIVDDVQNLYGCGRLPDFDFAFTSLRKWLPVPDGAFIITKSIKKDNLLDDITGKNIFAEYKFAGNLLKSYGEFVSDQLCLNLIEKGEQLLDEGYRCAMSEITRLILPSLDYELISNTRKKNAIYLHNRLSTMGIPHIFSEQAIPLFVPILISTKRDEVRKELFKRQIFCPSHWPYVSKKINGDNTLYQDELSLICDQRYGVSEMERILGVLEDVL